jgi:hypothetical protein
LEREDWDAYMPEINDETMDLVEYFEEEYDCGGICQPSLFYFGKSIEIGPPR